MPQIGVYVSDKIADDLEELAYRRRSSMSAIARELIEEEIQTARCDGELSIDGAPADD